MDNNFENDYYGYEPQRPVTEHESAPQEERPDVSQFQPQKPLMQEAAQPAEEQGFNPIQHTAVYGEDGFSGTPQPPVAPVQQTPQAQPPQPPYQGYYAPQPQPVYSAAQPPAAGEGKPQKNKVNTALVVTVIVMGVLLLAALFGLFGFSVYTARNSNNNSNSGNSNGFSYEIPEFTIPDGNGGGFQIPQIPNATEAPKTHEDTDFSDKVDKDYGGLKLSDKPSDAQTNSGYNAEYAFNAVSDSVVSVLCYQDKISDNDKADSQGSGIVISADGFVVTNAHVIGNSKTAYAIKVVAADKKEYTAGVVGFDSRTDLAVLKLVDAKDLKAAAFGDSEKLQLGEDLIIIGNPGGIDFQNSMAKGIVSALNRDASNKNIVKYIQTDAAINPGNSGGPAVNRYGQVVGIASAKIADEKYEGMGFCIPSAQAKKIIDSLIKTGYVEGRVKIGISGKAVTTADSTRYNLPLGIMVSTIDKDGPCDNTDLQPDDIITKLDDAKITTFAEIYEALEAHQPGDKVKLGFYRESDGKEYEIEITLQEDKR